MFSVDQRLFRPWDAASDSAKTCNEQTFITSKHSHIEDIMPPLKKLDETRNQLKRENRLRKISGQYKKRCKIDQDSTISTTTLDSEDQKATPQNPQESPVASLTECCDRLLQQPLNKINKNPHASAKINEPPASTEGKKYQTQKDVSKNLYTVPPPTLLLPPPELMPYPQEMYPGFVPELLPPAELAHALGLQPTDPLLLESLAQGYAMELEYARIMHQENQAKMLNARKQRPKKYKCPHCQVGFSNNGQLKGHVRIHTGERPFKCDDKNCGKTFTRNEELTRHKRIHSGVRPYACSTCGKKFGRRDHLKKHTRTHLVQAERMMPVFLPLSAVPHVGSFPYLYGY